MLPVVPVLQSMVAIHTSDQKHALENVQVGDWNDFNKSQQEPVRKGTVHAGFPSKQRLDERAQDQEEDDTNADFVNREQALLLLLIRSLFDVQCLKAKSALKCDEEIQDVRLEGLHLDEGEKAGEFGHLHRHQGCFDVGAFRQKTDKEAEVFFALHIIKQQQVDTLDEGKQEKCVGELVGPRGYMSHHDWSKFDANVQSESCNQDEDYAGKSLFEAHLWKFLRCSLLILCS